MKPTVLTGEHFIAGDVAFACNWCSYAGADYAGVSRLQYPSNVRLSRSVCSGRVDESFIRRGFAKRASP